MWDDCPSGAHPLTEKRNKPKRRDEAFKREAVRQLEHRGDRSVAELAKSLGVYPGQLYAWRRRYADTAAEARAERGETPEEEIKRLRREVAELRQEQEILKKAAAFFARESDR